ncbi:unnamed protein product [Oikopleura dioica]|uniref:UBA domain-containing protein n=1 Tax=Oikopleura dioica TaxID=34765 RepID=E4WSR4_OIKDI|nr:unnamed protein product [Oikopleura dioica]
MEELLKQGWGISEDGFEVLKSIREDKDDQNLPFYNIALDTDLSKITSRPLTDEMKKNLQHPTPLILQVKSVKNLGAPSISQNNNSNPRFLQVVLTDGKSSLTLLELRKTSKFTIETWPGTKVRLTGEMPQSGNYLEIDDSKIDILGGEVDALIEKWLVDKDSQNAEFRIKTFEQGGPPVFVPFEKRNAKHNKNKIGTEDISGKRVFNKDEKSDSEGEFEEQRASDLAKIETARVKFAKSRSLGVLPNNQQRDLENQYKREVNQRSSQSSAASTPVPVPESKVSKKPAPTKSSYYKALPTASGLELDKQKVKMLVEMGFQQADCIQAMQEADNDVERALDGLQSLSLTTRESSRDDNSRPTRGRGGKRGRRGRNNFEEEEKTRPQGSLMDFIGGDLPLSSKTIKT